MLEIPQADGFIKKRTERLVVYEDVKRRVGGDIPEDDYLCFIRPYENKRRCDELRATPDSTAGEGTQLE